MPKRTKERLPIHAIVVPHSSAEDVSENPSVMESIGAPRQRRVEEATETPLRRRMRGFRKKRQFSEPEDQEDKKRKMWRSRSTSPLKRLWRNLSRSPLRRRRKEEPVPVTKDEESAQERRLGIGPQGDASSIGTNDFLQTMDGAMADLLGPTHSSNHAQMLPRLGICPVRDPSFYVHPANDVSNDISNSSTGTGSLYYDDEEEITSRTNSWHEATMEEGSATGSRSVDSRGRKHERPAPVKPKSTKKKKKTGRSKKIKERTPTPKRGTSQELPVVQEDPVEEEEEATPKRSKQSSKSETSSRSGTPRKTNVKRKVRKVKDSQVVWTKPQPSHGTTSSSVPSLQPETPTSVASSESLLPTRILLMLLHPHSKFFELIQLVFDPETTTIGHLIDRIPSQATEARLAEQAYTGFVRSAKGSEAWTQRLQPASMLYGEKSAIPPAGIVRGDVLVAIPDGFTRRQVVRVGRQILESPRIKSLLVDKFQAEMRIPKSITTKEASEKDRKRSEADPVVTEKAKPITAVPEALSPMHRIFRAEAASRAKAEAAASIKAPSYWDLTRRVPERSSSDGLMQYVMPDKIRSLDAQTEPRKAIEPISSRILMTCSDDNDIAFAEAEAEEADEINDEVLAEDSLIDQDAVPGSQVLTVPLQIPETATVALPWEEPKLVNGVSPVLQRIGHLEGRLTGRKVIFVAEEPVELVDEGLAEPADEVKELFPDTESQDGDERLVDEQADDLPDDKEGAEVGEELCEPAPPAISEAKDGDEVHADDDDKLPEPKSVPTVNSQCDDLDANTGDEGTLPELDRERTTTSQAGDCEVQAGGHEKLNLSDTDHTAVTSESDDLEVETDNRELASQPDRVPVAPSETQGRQGELGNYQESTAVKAPTPAPSETQEMPPDLIEEKEGSEEMFESMGTAEHREILREALARVESLPAPPPPTLELFVKSPMISEDATVVTNNTLPSRAPLAMGGMYEEMSVAYSTWSQSVDSSLLSRYSLMSNGSATRSNLETEMADARARLRQRRRQRSKLKRSLQKLGLTVVMCCIGLYWVDPRRRLTGATSTEIVVSNSPMGMFGSLQFFLAIGVLIKVQMLWNRSTETKSDPCPFLEASRVFVKGMMK